nr:phosphonate ABC transporter, permease protein PhnE [uncultured Anaerosporobacter sp.]
MFRAIKNIFVPEKIVLSDGKEIKPPMPVTPYIIIGLLVAVYISINITGFSFKTLVDRGSYFFDIIKDMFPPDFGYASKVVSPLIETIKMSILGSIIGSFLAIPFAILSSVNITRSRVVIALVRFVLSITRTLPTLIIALLATYFFGLGTFAGTVAITIFTFGLVVKMLYEKIETVDMGPFEAMEAVGSTRLKAFIGSIMPQIASSYVAICLYSLELNVRYAAILGYVGAGGIGVILNEKIGWRQYDQVGMVLVMLFITVVIIEQVSKYVRERLG